MNGIDVIEKKVLGKGKFYFISNNKEVIFVD